MRFRTLPRRRVWIAAIAAAFLAIGGGVWASWGPTYTDLSEVPSTEVEPSAESRHPAPYYGTKVRFLPTPRQAFRRAALEGKLVLVLHLSGRFDSSETT